MSARGVLWHVLAVLAGGLAATPAAAQHAWAQFGGSPMRTSVSASSAPSIASASWVCSTDAQGNTITFGAQAGVAVSMDLVLAPGTVTPAGQGVQSNVFAIDRRTGAVAWAAAVPAAALDSWSTPAVDEARGTVIVASGSSAKAFALKTGAPVWSAALTHPVVDASPVVTGGGWGPGGLGVADRCFVTEYDGFGDDGRLTCINVGAYSAASNPFQPGQVVWSVVIGAASGNSPAVWNGRVFVTTAGYYGYGPGSVMAFDARARSVPEPLWSAENPWGQAFYGGVCVHARAGGADLYCASYAFYGGTESANLLKVDAATGEVRWSAPCNRTSATPVVLPDGRIAVSGGVAGYGTVPTFQLFRDDGAGATLLWDSYAGTWSDANHNGVVDAGEYLVLGGWSHQPIVTSAASARLFVGAIPASGAGACTDLYSVDVAKLPVSPGAATPGYLAQHFVGAGNTPAAADSNLYTIGAGGLRAFGPAPLRYDVDGDGRVGIDDLYAWEQGAGTRDVNLDGQVNAADREALIAELRRNEFEDMKGGLPR